MLIIPAIYIFNGKCVALYRGSFKQKDIYRISPLAYAKRFESEGASFIYLIDLNKSFNNENTNYALVENICNQINIPLIIGGGIRTAEQVDMWFDKGFDQVVLGVSAEPIYKQIIEKYGPEKIIAGIKSRGNEVQTEVETKFPIRVIDFAEKLPGFGIKKVMFKDILKESTQIGPNYDEPDRIIRMLSLEVYVSGGVSRYKHLELLKKIGVRAAVVGKALYENKIRLRENISKLEN